MHKSVVDIFPSFSVPLEGEVSSMYCDVLGLITVGVGCLIDPVSMALPLAWRHEKTGELAPRPRHLSAAMRGGLRRIDHDERNSQTSTPREYDRG